MPHDDVNGKVNDDLISRGQVMFDYLSNLGKRDSCKAKYEALCKAVDDAPAVDAAPVVHGRWIWVKDKEDPNVEHLRRSACMGSGVDEADGYCRHCGAKMDEGEVVND